MLGKGAVARVFLFFFFFNDTATTEIYTLSLHDALPIFPRFRATYQALAPAAPAKLAASEMPSAVPVLRCSRPARIACTASAARTPSAISGTHEAGIRPGPVANAPARVVTRVPELPGRTGFPLRPRSEEHTSELQSRRDLVCRLLLEKKKKK